MTFEARHIAQTIAVPPAAVARFVGDYANFPRWAAGLSAGIREVDGRWVTDSPMGLVEVRFTGETASGVLDHDVTLPDGTRVHNPLRVLRNDDEAEVVFTLYRLPGVEDAALDADAALIRADLDRLRGILEDDAS